MRAVKMDRQRQKGNGRGHAKKCADHAADARVQLVLPEDQCAYQNTCLRWRCGSLAKKGNRRLNQSRINSVLRNVSFVNRNNGRSARINDQPRCWTGVLVDAYDHNKFEKGGKRRAEVAYARRDGAAVWQNKRLYGSKRWVNNPCYAKSRQRATLDDAGDCAKCHGTWDGSKRRRLQPRGGAKPSRGCGAPLG